MLLVLTSLLERVAREPHDDAALAENTAAMLASFLGLQDRL